MTNPWHITPPAITQTEENRRYQRSLRLTQFQRDLDTWKRIGAIDNPRYAERVAYRRMCIERWQEYLDGKIEPPEGRKPKQ